MSGHGVGDLATPERGSLFDRPWHHIVAGTLDNLCENMVGIGVTSCHLEMHEKLPEHISTFVQKLGCINQPAT